MKKEGLNKSTLRALYYQNKNNVLPFSLTLLSFFLIIFFVIPQFQDYLVTRSQEEVLQARIIDLETKYNVVMSLQDSNLEKNLQTVSSAFPAYKDYNGIINGVSKAAANSGIALSDFSFSVGDLSTKAATLRRSALVNALPLININLSLNGNLQLTKKFIKNLSQEFPLSEVISVSGNNSSLSLSTNFYYKPFPSLTFNTELPILPLSNEQTILLNTLSSWYSAPINIPSSVNLLNLSELDSTSSASLSAQ